MHQSYCTWRARILLLRWTSVEVNFEGTTGDEMTYISKSWNQQLVVELPATLARSVQETWLGFPCLEMARLLACRPDLNNRSWLMGLIWCIIDSLPCVQDACIEVDAHVPQKRYNASNGCDTQPFLKQRKNSGGAQGWQCPGLNGTRPDLLLLGVALVLAWSDLAWLLVFGCWPESGSGLAWILGVVAPPRPIHIYIDY